MSKKYFIQVKFKNENEIIIEWKLPEEFEPKSTDIIGLYDYKSTNQHSITYSYNFKSNLEGKISLRIEYSQIMNKKLQARYLIENKSKSILSSEVFEIITLKKPKITIEEINEKQIEIKWKLPDLYVPNGYYPEYLDREECMIGPNDTIGLFLKSSLNSNPLDSQINPYTQKSGKCTFYIEEYIKYGNDQEFEFRYVSYTQQTIAKSESFFINTKIPETNLILSKDNFLFGELIEISWEFSEEIDMPKNNSWIGLFYEKSNNLKYIEQKNITQINRKGSMFFQIKDFQKINFLDNFQFRYFSNGHNIQGISKPFRFQLFENEGIEIITKNPLFGFPLYIQFKLPDGYNPNILDSISLFDYNPYSNLNDLPQKPLIEKFNTSLSRFGLIDFHLDPILKKKKVETENTNENQIHSFIVKYFSHPKNSDENKMLITSSHFEVDEPKDFKLSISKNEISFEDSIDIEWEFPEYFNPNNTDWIGLFLKDSPNNSFLNKQFNSTKLRKEKLKFEIGNYITDENQIFEFRYLPNNQYNSLIKSQEIKVKNFNIKDFKLSISKNEISFEDSINIEWEFPEYFNPNNTDWIGLFLKDSPNNSFLVRLFNSTKLRKGKKNVKIGNYITDQNQIFEFRYLPNNQYNSLIKSQEIKVKNFNIKDFKLSISKNEISFGDSINIEWELPEYFNPNNTDWIGLFLKDSPNNSFLNKQYNSTKLRKEKLTFEIGNYITDENQIFEFRYLPNNQYNSLIKSQEIKVISIKGRINLSTKKSRIGDTIKISWQLPNSYEANQNDQIIFFKSQFQSKDKELPKHFQIICKNEKCEKKAEREIKIQFGGGIIEEEFIIGYYSHYKLIICQSPIIIEPINFVGIKILNRINVGDKVQFLWSLPPIVTPLETDKFMILSLKESKPILIPNSNFIYNLSSTYSGISELEADFIREKDIIQDFVIEYIKDNEFSPIIISGIFRFEFPILSKNLQFDLLNLFLRQEFCDFTINHLDGNIQVHKLILLMRFDNDQSILTKINQILSSKTENQVIPFLIFIYTGMINPISTLDLDSFQKDEWNLIEVNHPFFSFYWKATQFNFEDSDSQELFQEYLKNPNDFSQIQNEKKIQSILQELGFDKNWIENKKDESGIKKDLVNLYLEKIEKTDFKIICDDSSEIKVHKLILISRSNLFREMFLNVQDDSNSVKDYSGKSKKSLEQLIHYFYFGEFNLNPKEDSTTIIQELKDTEDFYQLSQFNPFN
ncbi:hypothetical protein M0811_05623 [Anaeramoeba ignava]|uniref:BTB domain-containing protein n=1 Tax=Anaeramoeba ignava TaxID=1746090 RepID=A0A9Q0LUZ7_ANAIG|nr:hypothetical protein M0811_05623 [Anaeramoeba ignava]